MSKFEKTILKAKVSINPDFELCVKEFQALKEISADEFELIYNAFLFGYIRGQKATLAKTDKTS